MVDCITGLFEQISYSYLFPWNFKVPPMKRVGYIFPYLGFIWNKAENLVAWSIPTSSCFYLHSCTSAFLRRMCLLVPGWKRHKVKLSSLPLHMAFFFFSPHGSLCPLLLIWEHQSSDFQFTLNPVRCHLEAINELHLQRFSFYIRSHSWNQELAVEFIFSGDKIQSTTIC